jgi:hypothetical protein
MILKHKTSETLFSYWDKVRGNRTTPRRFEIEPGKIAAILPSTFILERIDAEAYRFRLAGTHVCELFGSELRGTNFLDGWSPSDRMALIRHFAAISKQGAVETIHMEAAPVARASSTFEVLLLPLRHTGEDIDRVLGAFTALESSKRAARCRRCCRLVMRASCAPSAASFGSSKAGLAVTTPIER